jgi:hypothetical protein
MAVRNALFLVPAALLLVPAAVFAQIPAPPAPPEVEQALRSRVTEFFQDFVDGKFRQAINLVADETQDEYFASTKADIKTFNIDGIVFSDNFTKADVKLTVKQVWKMRAEGFMQSMVVDSPWSTDWKIENGKWVYYHQIQPNGWATPMGPSEGFRKPDGSKPVPLSLDSATLNSEAQRILNQSSVDKSEVFFGPGKPDSAKVVFHNGAPGSVSISLVGLPNVLAGFSAKLDKQTVDAGQDAVIEISYNPPAGLENAPPPFALAVDVAPFGQEFPVVINFAAPAR